MDTSMQDIATVQALIDRHFDIWNDANPGNWAAKFTEAYAPDFFVADYQGMATGYVSVGQLIRRVQGEHPGFVFTPAAAEWNHGMGRVTWAYGPAQQPGLIRGEDIFTIRDGKLASMRVFLDKK
ncbi:MAG: hypothetical protein GAK35_02007 [Herbaspirillum frisingense]|uniref:Nuclear transport factor 2 family protein n=1 Tax=Herbaspirillum frisingense TaxID=92645 RepID=A0A7V8JUL6_9BURK|nr:MAG: hypothetical protein GAK35_02007 [Herbaspirillum frisingense]